MAVSLRKWAEREEKRAWHRYAGAGEGSRGGHIVGHTASGNPIYGEPRDIVHQENESGMSQVARKRLEAREAATVDKKTESALIVDKDGNAIIDKKGSTIRVKFTGDEIKAMKDCHLTHNHPDGYSLSPADLNLAVSANLASMRAVTRDSATKEVRVYSFNRPASGWHPLTRFNASGADEFARGIEYRSGLDRDHERWTRLQDGPPPGDRYADNKMSMPIDVGYRVEKRPG